VFCWGDNAFGQLGNGTTVASSTPVAVMALSGAVDVSAGGRSTCAIGSGSAVWCWGRNNWGQLGSGVRTDSAVPVRTGGVYAYEVDSSGAHALSNLAGGVQSWGLNEDNQLGHSETDYDVLVARYVDGFFLSDASAVAAGSNFSCLLRASGTVACFGSQEYGQLGNATSGFLTFGTVIPQTVLGLYDAIGLSSGGLHSCVLRANRDVVCWGDNDEGQLGDGTRTMRSVPVAVVGLR
jgi:alpha-tubulin suppressor-like RCC1 family protein